MEQQNKKIKALGLMKSITLTFETMPFMLARLTLLAAYGAAFLFMIGVSALLAKLWAPLYALAFIPLGIFMFARNYGLYLLKAAHVAVITHKITGKKIPEAGMVQYGKKAVLENFKQVNILFVVDSTVTKVINVFNHLIDGITSFLPIPGLNNIVGFIKVVIRASTTWIDEAIFSFNIINHNENVWASSRDGLILYAQNYKKILKTAVWIAVIDYSILGFVWLLQVLVLGALLGKFIGMFPIVMGTGMFSYVAREVFIKPVYMTMIISKYHEVIANQAPQKEWVERLNKIGGPFKEITQKADEFINSTAKEFKADPEPKINKAS